MCATLWGYRRHTFTGRERSKPTNDSSSGVLSYLHVPEASVASYLATCSQVEVLEGHPSLRCSRPRQPQDGSQVGGAPEPSRGAPEHQGHDESGGCGEGYEGQVHLQVALRSEVAKRALLCTRRAAGEHVIGACWASRIDSQARSPLRREPVLSSGARQERRAPRSEGSGDQRGHLESVEDQRRHGGASGSCKGGETVGTEA